MNNNLQEILNYHKYGKIEIKNRIDLKSRKELSIAYTPGVAKVCEIIAQNKDEIYNYTIKKNSVAVVTDGTAVLGLGNIGPAAALPVMEGKAMLFKRFANIDAYPICLDTTDVKEIINIVKKISVGFGGINLEDISAPRCFEIESQLINELDIPVFHDDQHGTAVVVLAGLINSLKLVNKNFNNIRVAILGAGAAGVAIIKILISKGINEIICCDKNGIIYKGRKENMNHSKEWIANNTNPENLKGDINTALNGADVFIGVSGPNLVSEEAIKKMNKNSIIFSLANPIPEIPYEISKKYAKIVATGRSDYPNQINNVLCFPGIFKAAFVNNIKKITEKIKLTTAEAIASIISDNELNEKFIIPDVFDERIIPTIIKKISVLKENENY
ncbi:MAG TPA: NADP-dependent malic enzyme [bacterium]|nr:NADP-dependent malic enzyme [bacterium]HOL47044.1 NADP-dependent malic enzyme [bacterium]HPQ17951.1 NADP-dependent malic enzyme [bacterium]